MTAESPEQLAWDTAAELAAGRLPVTTQRRIAERRRAAAAGRTSFTSGLSVAEFAALRSVGFAPVDQVMGAAVVNLGWLVTPTGGCASYRYGPSPSVVVPVPAIHGVLRGACGRVLDRMRQECAALGGDGVVGVRMRVRSFLGNTREFLVTGTAVRAAGGVRPPAPFTCDLSCQDFAKLVHAGWLPAALVMGVGVALRHDDVSQRLQRWSWQNQELTGWTGLVHAARASARNDLHDDVRRTGAARAVLRDTSLFVTPFTCALDGTDRVAEAMLIGTALIPLGHAADPAAARPLTIMRLDRRIP